MPLLLSLPAACLLQTWSSSMLDRRVAMALTADVMPACQPQPARVAIVSVVVLVWALAALLVTIVLTWPVTALGNLIGAALAQRCVSLAFVPPKMSKNPRKWS